MLAAARDRAGREQKDGAVKRLRKISCGQEFRDPRRGTGPIGGSDVRLLHHVADVAAIGERVGGGRYRKSDEQTPQRTRGERPKRGMGGAIELLEESEKPERGQPGEEPLTGGRRESSNIGERRCEEVDAQNQKKSRQLEVTRKPESH